MQAATTMTIVGIGIATRPAREVAGAISRGVSDVLSGRRRWCGNGRAWIEVHGLHGSRGRELGSAVLAEVRAQPGVTSASLNYPLSRLVVGMDGDRTQLRELCDVVAGVERNHRDDTSGDPPGGPGSLPGDGLLMAGKVVAAGANAVGLGAAVVGRALRLPPLPPSLEAVVAVVDYQPRLRRLLEDRIGTSATDTALTLAMAAAHTLTLAPAALAVDLTMGALSIAECRAETQAWHRLEPELAAHADAPETHPVRRPAPARPGRVERHATLAATVQAVGAVLVGVGTRTVGMASTAALVAVPRAARTTRESFAATLGRGLADQHAVLPLRPDSLRRLDRVDTVVIDPRVLCDGRLRVVAVRGAADGELAAVWACAQARLDDDGLRPGWQPVDDRGPDPVAEALYLPMHHPLAAAVVGEARRSGVEVISVDTDVLDDLRPVFDEIQSFDIGSLDDALATVVTDLQRDGRYVAVLSSTASRALSAADVALGIVGNTSPPPWYADLLLPDLLGAWRVLHALPAARAAGRRGTEIATGASALGALLMLPKVRGRGPGPVNAGAAAGLLSGYLLARRTISVAAPQPRPIHEWHAMSVEQVRRLLPTPRHDWAPEATHSPMAALALAGVELARRGVRLGEPPRRALFQFANAVRAELSDPLTPVLALGSAASAVLGSPVDAIMVGSVLTGNSILAASQRLRAENQLNRLLAQQVPPARVVRTGPDGEPVYTDAVAAQLQPGDLIEVRADEVVPADARLVEAGDVEVDESSLTGESLPVDKQVEATPGADLGDRRCMLFAGTTVMTGTALALVTAVGADTQVQRAAELASGENESVGLTHQLSQLANRTWPVSLAGGALVGGLGLLHRGRLRDAVADGVAVTVAAVPEGLPLVATLAQQAAVRRLTNLGALVRVPRSVEALGRVDVVCFDKTGTLSENRLRVAQVHPVSGNTPEEVLRCAELATPNSDSGAHIHSTDTAISAAARAVTGSAPTSDAVAHLAFRPGRSYSASVFDDELTVKGAPEVVRAACGDRSAAMTGTVTRLAADGLRVIAVARRRLDPQQVQAVHDDPDTIEELCADGLSLTGFLGLSDTPRGESAGLLADLQGYGISVRLITGDHPVTATAIARELGMPVSPEQVISGAQWDALSRKGRERAVTDRVIFARMSPANKVQIVQTLERAGKVCAMVGDGSNDAAAIRAATVGVGVVGRGSDPAHTAADVVLVDGRIEALLPAIEEGRQLWQRVQAAVSVLLGGNAGEVGFATIGSAITGRSPLNTRQLLLVNMLTDALPAAALAVSTPNNPVASGACGPDEAALWRAVGIRGATTAAAATAAWAMAAVTGRPRRASTVALVALVSAQLGQTLLDSHAPLVVLTAGGSLAVMGTLISIPGVSQFLGCTPLGPVGWAQALGSAGAAVGAAAVLPRLLGRPSESAPPQPATAAPAPALTEQSTPTGASKPTGRPQRRPSTKTVGQRQRRPAAKPAYGKVNEGGQAVTS